MATWRSQGSWLPAMQRNKNSGWILKEKYRQVHSGFFKKCGEKSARLKVRRLGSDSDSVTHSLGDCGQVTSPLWVLVSITVTWKIETEDLKALSPSKNGGALCSLSTRLAFVSLWVLQHTVLAPEGGTPPHRSKSRPPFKTWLYPFSYRWYSLIRCCP